ncbi:thioredoxin family protein [Limibacterium fermenti]|uniref:thioredoxin family protein n=1 Tax=Limibacterium fermenti TaxID=3229863 RepID=UPI000E9AC8E5|nr:hypothetical protein [Porphyromonadaceae bacterium]
MIRNSILALFILRLFVLPSLLTAQDAGGVKFENKPLKEILDIAKARNKLVFVDCYTTWCGPCRKMANEVFPQKMLGDYMNHAFVSVKIDMEKGEGIGLVKQWDINSYPTYLVLDADGNEKFRMLGYFEPQALIDTLNVKLRNDTPSVLEQRYEAGERTPELIREYIAELSRVNRLNRVETVAEEFCNRRPETLLSDEEAFDIFCTYITNPDNPSFLYVYKHRSEFISKYGAQIGEMLEDRWRMYAKSFYLTDVGTDEFKGYDKLKMDEYENFMKQNGVSKAAEYTMMYKLPASIIMNDKELLFKNLEQSATMAGISQSQFDYACSTLEKSLTEKSEREQLEKIKELRKQLNNSVK